MSHGLPHGVYLGVPCVLLAPMSVDRDLPPLATVPLGALGIILGAFALAFWVAVGLVLLAAGGFLMLVGAVSLGVEVGIRRARR